MRRRRRQKGGRGNEGEKRTWLSRKVMSKCLCASTPDAGSIPSILTRFGCFITPPAIPLSATSTSSVLVPSIVVSFPSPLDVADGAGAMSLSSASLPFSAVVTRQPSRSIMRDMSLRVKASSSTTRTRRGPSGKSRILLPVLAGGLPAREGVTTGEEAEEGEAEVRVTWAGAEAEETWERFSGRRNG